MIAEHNAYTPTHGLWHKRSLRLSLDGRSLEGEDRARNPRAKENEAHARRRATDAAPEPLPLPIRFHLHPDTQSDWR